MLRLAAALIVSGGLPLLASAVSAAPAAHSDYEQCRALGLTSCPQPFDAHLPGAKDMLNWDQESRLVGFRNTYRFYPGDVFHTLSGRALALPALPSGLPSISYDMDGRPLSLQDYQRRQSVAGLLILKNGRIAYEYYSGGNTEKTLWTSRSVAKSVVSVLIGMAIKEGFIGSVDDPVDKYLPELAAGAWKGVTLRQLLQHTSGIAWNEDYADPESDFSHLTACEAGDHAYECIQHLVTAAQRSPGVSPGEVWSYNTGGAWLAGRLLERATQMTIAHYLETRLWSRFAMEQDGVWQALIEGEVDMGGHGFNATLRDWGRFGLFVAQGGRLATGERLLPAEWLAQSTAWTRAKGSVIAGAPAGQFGYQWWFGAVDPTRPGAKAALKIAQHSLWAEGIYGQTIAIDPIDKLVMVQWSTWKDAHPAPPLYDEQALFFSAVARALAQSP